jgi:NTP pyrophosphatase (non-canonical NTP hydrolase)
VSSALDAVRTAALDRALDPRNVAKGSWRDMPEDALRELLVGEVVELLVALRREPLERVLAEAGDVVWCVAMAVDRARERGRDG